CRRYCARLIVRRADQWGRPCARRVGGKWRYEVLTPCERLDVRAEVRKLDLADAIEAVLRHAPSALADDEDLEPARDREVGGAVADRPVAGGASRREVDRGAAAGRAAPGVGARELGGGWRGGRVGPAGPGLG